MASNFYQLHKETYLPFEITIDTTIAGSSGVGKFQLPFTSIGGVKYRCIVDWGDGTTDKITTWNQAETLHTYSVAGTHTIKITGRCDAFRFDNAGDKLKLSTIENFGNIVWKTFSAMFYGCSNMVGNFTDTPVLEYVTDMSSAFRSCSNFNSNVSDFDTKRVTNFSLCFGSSSIFNNGEASGASTNPLTWDTSSATSMGAMLAVCYAFNQPLPFDVSNVTNFNQLFILSSSFNQDISAWNINTSAPVDMSKMFESASSFNQQLTWDMSQVNNITSMFRSATDFNQNLSSWNTVSVTSLSLTFNLATSFNNGEASGASTAPLTWNTSNVTNMLGTFTVCSALNQPLPFDVSSVTTFKDCFNLCNNFNQDITGWTINTVSPVVMESMFQDNSIFNQDISVWNVTQVTNIKEMFSSATAFNHNISSWNISNVTNATSFMLGKSNANYTISFLDAIYNTWSGLALQSGVSIHFGTINYTIATSQAGRDILTNAPNNWVVTDGGGI